jgi:hypothetical protein
MLENRYHGRNDLLTKGANMKQIGNAAFALIFGVTVALAAAFGWGWNIVKLAEMSFDPLTGMIVVRIVGIFIPPIGAIVGYL